MALDPAATSRPSERSPRDQPTGWPSSLHVKKRGSSSTLSHLFSQGVCLSGTSGSRFAANAAIAVPASSCPRVLYVRRGELKEISPEAVDVSSFDEAKRVASVAEEERRIIEAERRRLGLDA